LKRKKNCLDLHGVLLLDKPVGLTSNDALQKAKRLLNACKAGHTGSLDPIATGLLPLCFGDATRLSQFLLDSDKRYWAVFRLGATTTTYDSEGDVTRTRAVNVTRADVERVLPRFTGAISQVPPMYSAIKRGGQPLYKLARAGQEVEREPREIVVHEMKFLGLDGDRLTLEIHCSKGTYIRTLAYDIGEALDCGAHVVELRRLGVGTLHVDQAVTLASLEALATPQERAQRLLALDSVLGGIPEVHLTALAAHYLRQGQPVSLQHGREPGWVRLYEGESRFLGLGQVLDDGRVAPRRLLGAGKGA
jgi:tRNA pseudouridine55 synthase